jgi:SAM-dependent methyltransferase
MLRAVIDTLGGYSAMMSVLLSLLLTLRTLARSRAALQLEILAVRHQLEVLQRTRPPRMRLAKTDRWRWVVLSRFWSGWRTALVIVEPETVIAWHQRGFGPTGTVYGIDASPEMIARASKKAKKADVDVAFKNGLAEALPFPDARFDAVLTTVMLHHLPRKPRQQCVGEMRRVLKPDGRVLAVDFGGTSREREGVIARSHRHGHVDLRDLITVLSEAGLNSVESGAVGIHDLQFVLAVPSCCA